MKGTKDKMIYETNNHWFIKDDGTKIELTNLEHKLLMILSRAIGSLVTYTELAKYIYGVGDKCAQYSIKVLKYRLFKKTNLDIVAVNNEGDIIKTFCNKGYGKRAKKVEVISQVIYCVSVGKTIGGSDTNYFSGFETKQLNKQDWTNGEWSMFFECEVIGNIYENPELLKKEEG